MSVGEQRKMRIVYLFALQRPVVGEISGSTNDLRRDVRR